MRLLCDAIAFCYGPATVLKQVLACWRSAFEHITLIGDGTTMEFMARTGLVDSIIEVDTEDPEELSAIEGHWDVLFSVCNPVGFSVLKRRARFTIFWDFLLWMRTEGQAEEFEADRYIVEMFLGCREALSRWGSCIRAPLACPVVVDWVDAPCQSEGDIIVVTLGGQRSRLTRPGENTLYPQLMVGALQRAADRAGCQRPFLVTCDTRTARELERDYAKEGWTFLSLEHEAFLVQLGRAERVFSHPGLYSPFEAVAHRRPLFLLPSSNYTQILQMKDFRRSGLASYSMDWIDLLNRDVCFGLSEPEGVRCVLDLVTAGNALDVQDQMVHRLTEWLKQDPVELKHLVTTQRAAINHCFGDYKAVLAQVLLDIRVALT